MAGVRADGNHGGHGGHDRHERHGGHGGGGGGGGNGGNSGPSNNMNSNRPRSAAALRHQTFDSHCLDVRVRGNAWQVCEKYQSLARDATSSGDRVAAEKLSAACRTLFPHYRSDQRCDGARAASARRSAGTILASSRTCRLVISRLRKVASRISGAPTVDANGNPLPAAAQGQPQQQQQAEVTQQRPPQQPTAFFSNEKRKRVRGPKRWLHGVNQE